MQTETKILTNTGCLAFEKTKCNHKESDNLESFALLILSGSNALLEERLNVYKAKQVPKNPQWYLLWGIAWAVKNRKAMQLVDEFDPDLENICRIKLLANRFGITGTGQVNGRPFNLGDLNDKIALRALYDSLKAFLDPDLPERGAILATFKNALEVRKEIDPEKKAEKIFELYKKGETVFLPLLYDLGVISHYYGILLKGDRFVKLNKGLKQKLPAGLHFYRFDQVQITPKFIKQLITSNMTTDYFERRIDSDLGLIPITFIPTSSSIREGCAWNLSKLAFRGTHLLESLKKEGSTAEVVFSPPDLYKLWKNADLFKEGTFYLKQGQIDPELLTAMWCRTKDETLGKTIESQLNGVISPTALPLAAESNNRIVVKQLLSAGFDINSQDAEGRTPLMRAACRGHIAMVQLLLENGADINRVDKEGISVLCHVKIEQLHMPEKSKIEARLMEIEELLFSLEPAPDLTKYLESILQ